jgi:hypothetical protein
MNETSHAGLAYAAGNAPATTVATAAAALRDYPPKAISLLPLAVVDLCSGTRCFLVVCLDGHPVNGCDQFDLPSTRSAQTQSKKADIFV